MNKIVKICVFLIFCGLSLIIISNFVEFSEEINVGEEKDLLYTQDYPNVYAVKEDLDSVTDFEIPYWAKEDIVNEVIACKIADAVFNEYMGEDFIKEKSEITIGFDEAQGIYVITRSEPDVLGGCISIAINKNDGKILKVYSGE